MKKALYALAATAAILVGAALLVPSFVDRNYYVGEIQTRIKAMTGRDLTIAGKVDLSLLPQPTVLVEDIRLSNAEGAAVPDMVTLKSLELRVAVLPLLAGRIEVASLALNRPVVELETLSGGEANWQFAAMTETDSAAPGRGEAAGEAGGAGLIKLDRLVITDGVIVYRDSRSGLLERINDLDAEVSVRSPEGPILATGTALPRGVPTRFDISVGEIEPQKPVTVGAVLAIEPGGSRIEFKGEISRADKGALTGNLHAEAGDLGKFLHAMLGETGAPPGLAQRFVLNGNVAASSQRVNLSDIEITLGDSHATGSVESVFAKPARTAIKIVADRIDLDPLLEARPSPVAANSANKPPPQPGKPMNGSAKHGGGAATANGDFALPPDLAGSVDLQARTIHYRQDEIRDAQVIAQLAGGQLTLQRATARLPGDGAVALTGAITTRNAAPRFDGGVELSAGDPHALLVWLGADIGTVPAGRLKKLSLSSRVAANAEEVQIRDMKMGFDSTRATGAITIALRERPAFGANIFVDRLVLNSYLPQAKPAQSNESAAENSTGAKPDRAKSGAGGMTALSPLEGFDANLQMRVAQLSYKSVEMQGFALDGTLHNGVLVLRDLSVQDLAGAQGKFSGTLSGFSATPRVKANLDLRSNDLPRLLRLAGASAPGSAEKLGKVTLVGTANTAGQDVDLDLGLGIWSGTARVKGRLGDLATNPKYNLDLALDVPDAAMMLRAFVPALPAGSKLGDIKLRGNATGDMATVALTGLKGNLGASSLAGEVQAAFAQARPKYTISLTTGELPLALLGIGGGANPQAASAAPSGKAGSPSPKRTAERWSREPYDTASLKSFDAELKLQAAALRLEKYAIVNAAVEATVADGAFELRKLKGKLFDGALDVKAKLNAEGGASAEVSLDQFDVDQALKGLADLDRASGRANFKGALRGTAKSEYDVISSLAGQGAIDGTVTVRVKEKEMTGAAVLGLLAAQVKGFQGFAGATNALLNAFGSAPAILKGSFTADKGAIRTNDLRLDSARGTALVAGQVNLPPYSVDGQAKVSLKSAPNEPVLTVGATGALDQPDLKIGGSAVQGMKSSPPGAESTKPQSPSEQPQQKLKDQLKGILKGRGG